MASALWLMASSMASRRRGTIFCIVTAYAPGLLPLLPPLPLRYLTISLYSRRQ